MSILASSDYTISTFSKMQKITDIYNSRSSKEFYCFKDVMNLFSHTNILSFKFRWVIKITWSTDMIYWNWKLYSSFTSQNVCTLQFSHCCRWTPLIFIFNPLLSNSRTRKFRLVAPPHESDFSLEKYWYFKEQLL